MFREEYQLVEKFRKTSKSKSHSFQLKKTDVEFSHLTGRTDIIGLTDDGLLIAIEAKLKNWKSALNQAYKNTSFAHYSYVLLPPTVLKPAVQNKDEFIKRNVGLLTIEKGEIQIIFNAEINAPFIPRITNEAMELLSID
ncbi:MAG: hypothetical protein C4517_15630 [Stygiobacter sp.]|nr:MAG: hypothetical protein C4517_15630 [Stygiobacter sp.]